MAIVLSDNGAVSTTALSGKSISVNTSSDSSDWWVTPLQWAGSGGDAYHPILLRNLSYGELYVRQLWVNIVIDKLVRLAVAPELTVYRSRPRGRQVANDTDYARLIRNPNQRHDPVSWWTWMFSMFFIHGTCFAYKQRDAAGRPFQLHGLHPTRMRYGSANWGYEWDNGSGLTGDPATARWWWRRNDGSEMPLDRRDLVIIHTFNPHSMEVGLSKLEALRDTLENEDKAREANTAMWENGGRPSFVLKHPGKFGNSPRSVQALADQFQRKHGGVRNWGRPLVLEENMEAIPLDIKNDLRYIEVRALNTQEVVSAYDIPPVAVGLLEKGGAGTSIIELHRSIYRDTMPPIFRIFESALDHDLRDGTFSIDRRPDFPAGLSAAWALDAFLKATPEEKTKQDAQAVQTGQKTLAEVRAENDLPFIPGTDTLLVNAAITPLESVLDTNAGGVDIAHLADIINKIKAAVGESIITVEEARDMIRLAGGKLQRGLPEELKPKPVPPQLGGPPAEGGDGQAPPPNSGLGEDGTSNSNNPGLATPPDIRPGARPAQPPGNSSTRALWGALGRIETLDEIDLGTLAHLAPPHLRAKVLGAYILVRDDNGTVAEFRNTLKQLGIGQHV